MFWLLVALYVGSTVAQAVLSGLLAKRPTIEATALGDMQVPTAEEGRNLPVVWGTCNCRAPNVVWYGDYAVSRVKIAVPILNIQLDSNSGAYWYYLTMDLALCHGPVDAFVGLMAGVGEDLKPIAWSSGGPNADGSLAIEATDRACFGGDAKEGGLSGKGTFYFGSLTQQSDPVISQALALTYPAYQGVCHVVCNHWYLGTSPYIKNLAFVVRRCPSRLGLRVEQTNLDGDANPAEIIYECLMNTAWGLRFPEARLDLASFAAAGTTLATEGLGMSLMLDKPQQADQVIERILQHIDGVCYTDPATGLWTLKLVRPDYVIGALPEFGPDQVAECEFSRGSWDDTLNEVKVTFMDRATWKTGTVQAQDGSNYKIRNGELATTTMDFSGFSNAATAQKICNREMRTHSYPIGQGRVKVNRAAWALRMGSAFRLTWPPLGIDGMAVRVTSIDYGNLTDGAIEIQICEDVFSAAYTAYSAPAAGRWVNPAGGAPLAPLGQFLQEAPYQVLSAADRRLLCAAVRADGISDRYDVWTDDGAGYYQTASVPTFCPAGRLTAAYPRTTDATDAVGFAVAGIDLAAVLSTDAAGQARGDALLVIVDDDGGCEWCAFRTVTADVDGSYTIAPIVRGIFDTVPRDHALGAGVLFLIDAGAYNAAVTRQLPYGAGETVSVKCLPHNPQGSVAIAAVTPVSVTTGDRAAAPYPPGQVKVAGTPWPDGATLHGDVTITWAHRLRTAQSGRAIVAQDAASVAGGPEGTYTAEVLIDGVVVRTEAGIAGTSFTYTLAQRAADDADPAKLVQVRLTPVNGALSGTPRTTDPFLMTA